MTGLDKNKSSSKNRTAYVHDDTRCETKLMSVPRTTVHVAKQNRCPKRLPPSRSENVPAKQLLPFTKHAGTSSACVLVCPLHTQVVQEQLPSSGFLKTFVRALCSLAFCFSKPGSKSSSRARINTPYRYPQTVDTAMG